MAGAGSANFRAVTWPTDLGGTEHRFEVAGEIDLPQPAAALVMLPGISENPNILVLELEPLTLHEQITTPVVTREKAGYLLVQGPPFEFETVQVYLKGDLVATVEVHIIHS